jgi:glycosyltransferase involved in cell wall biosynthesis
MPQISIIVPVYRAEKTLETCVNSVLAQTFGDWELILVDDGSDDESGRMCDTFSAADARIKVIHQQNAGVSAARNAGIAEASGDWIAFLDSDDWLEPQMYETLLNEMHKTGADTAGCGHWNVFPSGKREAEGGVSPRGDLRPGRNPCRRGGASPPGPYRGPERSSQRVCLAVSVPQQDYLGARNLLFRRLSGRRGFSHRLFLAGPSGWS